MDLVGIIDDSHKLTFSPAMRGFLESFLKSCKPDQTVIVSLKKQRKKQTDAQRRTIWGLLIGTISNSLDEMGIDLGCLVPHADIPDGQPIPKDVIMAILYATCNDVGENGERKTLSNMDIQETSLFFEKCRNYVASRWGVVVPDPDPFWRENRKDPK